VISAPGSLDSARVHRVRCAGCPGGPDLVGSGLSFILRRHAVAALLALAAVGVLLGLAGCMNGPPPSMVSSGLSPACEGTQPGDACLLLVFSTTPDVQKQVPTRVQGVLRWALYHGGDVDLFGPGGHKSVYFGDLPDLDLTKPYSLHLPDVVAGSYQVLAYLDPDNVGHTVSGDPVTFPSDAFMVPADRETRVEVALDYVR
jgi:hypothetical protein